MDNSRRYPDFGKPPKIGVNEVIGKSTCSLSILSPENWVIHDFQSHTLLREAQAEWFPFGEGRHAAYWPTAYWPHGFLFWKKDLV